MKYQIALLALAGLASARDVAQYFAKMGMLQKREVPQEHSHEAILRAANVFLKLNNPLEIQDAVFALLGNAAAALGAPNVANLNCLQQIIADQAFTNAKAANDLDGMINAILFRAIEKNTLTVGELSVNCDEAAINPEIAAIQQHQDPAAAGATEINAAIELAVAVQIASIGGDPILALQSATFPPGEIGDPTAAGNTCNDETDPVGCIITLGLLTPVVSEAEIQAAVEAAGAGNGAAAAAGGNADANACEVVVVDAVAEGKGKAAKGKAAKGKGNAAAGAAAQVATGTVNVQSFTGALGGPAPPVESTAGADRPFAVNGATFLNAGAALQRSCAVQKNACANAANSGQLAGGAAQCDAQENECRASANLRRRRARMAERRRV